MVEWVVSRLAAAAEYATHVGDDWEPITYDFLAPLGDDGETIFARIAGLVET